MKFSCNITTSYISLDTQILSTTGSIYSQLKVKTLLTTHLPNSNVNLKYFSTLYLQVVSHSCDEDMSCQTERTMRASHGQVKRLNEQTPQRVSSKHQVI